MRSSAAAPSGVRRNAGPVVFIECTSQPNSITFPRTALAERAPDFFDAERFPEIVVEVTGIAPDGTPAATLSIRGTTLPLPITATVGRLDPTRVTITARGDIDRTRWDVGGNMLGMMPPATTLVTEAVFTR